MTLTTGEKIKKLRKELKLTQSQLTGDIMTKSMLSQIENNNASPSMKNLKYLANKLHKPISFFLDDKSDDSTDSKEMLNESLSSTQLSIIKEEIDIIQILMKKYNIKMAKEKLEILLKHYDFNKNSKLYADILCKLGECLGHLNDYDKSEEVINKAIEIYSSNQLYVDAAKANIDISIRFLKNFDYSKSLEIINDAYDIYQKSINQDIFFEIEYLYYKALIISAIGNTEEFFKIMHNAIKMSEQTNVYYKSDELYRMQANMYFLLERYEDYLYNLKKARQFAEFRENNMSLGFIEYSLALYENTNDNPSAALEHLDKADELLGDVFSLDPVERAKSYYLLKDYTTAYEVIRKTDYSNERIHHLFDFLHLWRGKVYEGLILNKLGKSVKGIKAIKAGIQKMETVRESKYLAFAYQSLSEVYSDISNYEEAFRALKTADEIKNNIKGVPF